MPLVNGKHYAYTNKGVAQAAKAAGALSDADVAVLTKKRLTSVGGPRVKDLFKRKKQITSDGVMPLRKK